MSLTTARNRKPTALPRNTGDSPADWVRPAAWLTLPDISTTNNRFVGLFRIDPESNFLALQATVAGGYTVDWGDGTITTHASAVNANKQYTYSSIDNTGESSLGHRQVVVTVYPTIAGNNITGLSLQQRHSQAGLNTSARTPWLEIAVNATAASVLNIGGSTTPLPQLRQATIFSHSATSLVDLFFGCSALRSVPLFNTAAVTNMSTMFSGCSSLATVPLFNTAAVTNMSSMFSGCSSLATVPLFNTAAVTDMSSMFNGCRSLRSVPLFNTAAATSMVSMFSSCSALATVPLFNTAAVTSMSSMFASCLALTSVPQFNTAAVTNMFNMFSGCSSLAAVPLFNTAAVTNMSNLFNGCTSLATVPLFSTAAVTNMSGMFSACQALASVPAFVASAVTTGNFGTMFNNCVSLSSAPLSGTNQTISYANCKLSAAALDAIYTGLSSTGAGKTITVTGNWGTATDTPSIATAKGWTVTG